MFGIPVVDTVQATKTVLKFVVFTGFVATILAFVPDIKDLLMLTINKALSSFDLINGLDLGCFAGLIGLDSFLNAVFNSLYLGSVAYVSAIGSILSVKYGIQLMGLAMRI